MDDANGETVFASLGSAAAVFGSTAGTPVPSATPAPGSPAPSASAAPTASTGSLAATGVDVGWLAAAAAVLLGLGSLALRRRYRTR